MADKSSRLTVKLGQTAQGIVYFSKPGSLYPGWYCQNKNKAGKLETHRLWTEDADNVEAAVQEAAHLLGCLPEQILVRKE